MISWKIKKFYAKTPNSRYFYRLFNLNKKEKKMNYRKCMLNVNCKTCSDYFKCGRGSDINEQSRKTKKEWAKYNAVLQDRRKSKKKRKNK